VKHWPAKRIQGEIAARNAVKIRAALAVSVNARKVAQDFLASQPEITDNTTQDRVRARMWALLNVNMDVAPLRRMIQQVRIEGWLTGKKAADHSIKQVVKKNKTVSLMEIALDPSADVWDDWKPGDIVSAALLGREYGLDILLQQAGLTIKEISKTSLDRIGTRLADGVRQGLSVDKIAASIADDIADPARALSIAMTETTRATMLAAVDRYKEANIRQMQWSGMDPCEVCARNDGEIVNIGDPFPSGDLEPPAHPNCLCSLLPVIDTVAIKDVNPDADAATANLYEESISREMTLTPELIEIQRSLAEQNLEPSFSGLRFRLKQKKSLRRKILDEYGKGEFRTIADAASSLSDAVRYTYVWDQGVYVAGVQRTLNALQEKGYGLRVKNYWQRADYKGINVSVTDRTGRNFELQFHTTLSVAVKEDLHALYEKYRVSKNNRERWDLWNQMTRIASRISNPKDFQDLLQIGTIKREYFTDSRGVARLGNTGLWSTSNKGAR
jgi:SPP1 gp7 family putative phage head morphogenesis protein